MKIKKLKAFALVIIFLTVIFVFIVLAHYYDIQEKDENYTHYGETYIINIRSKKIHQTDCGTAKRIYEKNRKVYSGAIEELLAEGYTFCGNCFREND